MTRSHRRSAPSRELLSEVELWADRLGTRPDVIYVQSMKKKWASCRPAGRKIYFSADLVGEPKRFRDAVIVHELIHLRLANHGKLFKSLMDSFVPGWADAVRGRSSRVCGSA
jgi:predicted metal-dependent hydrolase